MREARRWVGTRVLVELGVDACLLVLMEAIGDVNLAQIVSSSFLPLPPLWSLLVATSLAHLATSTAAVTRTHSLSLSPSRLALNWQLDYQKNEFTAEVEYSSIRPGGVHAGKN